MSRPLDVLTTALNKKVILKVRGHREIRGILRSYDPHLNLYLEDAEMIYSTKEAEDQGEITESLGNIILRGDNVILISPP
ncbi:MAG: LSM domain-containing protein [Candidatus Hodarchaeales archaeon]|jgi:small nuclear ribonucleoprotein